MISGDAPCVVPGGLVVDDRGSVSFVNEMGFQGIKRFYTVVNHRAGLVRAWHAHRREAKYVMVVSGAAVVATVAIDDWDDPSKDLRVHRYTLSVNKPEILYIPPGFANGFMNLTADTRLLFYSTSTLEESQQDDVRFDAYYWNPWKIIER